MPLKKETIRKEHEKVAIRRTRRFFKLIKYAKVVESEICICFQVLYKFPSVRANVSIMKRTKLNWTLNLHNNANKLSK